MASVSYKQLRGEKISLDSDTDSCEPVVFNKDIDFRKKSISGKDLEPNAVAHPCGIAARSVFNDTFTMKDPNGNPVVISSKGIAWEDDMTYRCLRGKSNSKVQKRGFDDPVERRGG